MTTFEYLAVFVSIVVGLAVVRLLRGVVTIATGRGLRPYWVHTTWLAFHLIWLPYFWWFTFGWRTQEIWTFPLFFFDVAYSMVAYAVIAALLPEDSSGLRDYEEYYFRARHPLRGLRTSTAWGRPTSLRWAFGLSATSLRAKPRADGTTRRGSLCTS